MYSVHAAVTAEISCAWRSYNWRGKAAASCFTSSRKVGLANKIRTYQLQDGGLDTFEANRVLGFEDDERANFLALNLMHDIVTGAKTVQEARQYYAKEFADYRRKNPTPYMEGLRFAPASSAAGDPDERALSDEDLEAAKKEGKQRGKN
jgi:hypothetical protein